jgi:membrane-associated HD superfamily phosphohydrolase
MRELQAVAASFKSTLRAVYHPRIEYPTPAPEEIAAMAGTG